MKTNWRQAIEHIKQTAHSPLITRFAPSITGHLHLGHVAHGIFLWGVARATGASVIFRLEDHDQSRFRAEFLDSLFADMAWLGFRPDDGYVDHERPSPFRQSDCEDVYLSALQGLINRQLVYSCQCTRKDIKRQQTAAQLEYRYPGSCRKLEMPLDAPNTCLRLRITNQTITCKDVLSGRSEQQPSLQCGDMVIRDKDGQWTYNFAVVIDDLRHGVNLIVRGQDLAHTMGRQLLLRQYFDRSTKALYFMHHPLVVDASDRKLSKRDAAHSIASLRSSGVAANDVLGEAAFAVGIIDKPAPHTLDQIIEKVFL